MDDFGVVYHAGRCLDMVALGHGNIVVATDTGGAWSIDGIYKATPMSDAWQSPDMECLVFGPSGPNHLMAGSRGALYETDPNRSNLTSPSPVFEWRTVTLPPGVETVHRIATTAEPARVVLASDKGVWWSLADPNSNYAWKPALGAPSSSGVAPVNRQLAQEDFFGLAATSIGVIAGVGFPATARGIYYGDWQTGDLIMRPAAYGPGVTADKMRQISLAVCATVPARVYALTVGTDTDLLYLLRSNDGGAHWVNLPTTLAPHDHGNDQLSQFFLGSDAGGVHKTISVHPEDPDAVAFSGLRSCISSNGGQSWTPIGGTWVPQPGGQPSVWGYTQDPPHLHEDTHTVYFDTTFTNDRIYVLSDGGVAECANWRTDLTTFKSAPNRNLTNLQFLSTQPQNDGFWGTLGVAGDGILGGGLQDNGNVYCKVDLAGGLTPWRQSQDGDGGWVAFISAPSGGDVDLSAPPQQMLAHTSDQPDHNPTYRFTFDRVHTMFDEQNTIPLKTRFGFVDNVGIKFAIAEPVPRPRRDRAGRILYAAGAGQVVAGDILNPIPIDVDGQDIPNQILFALYGNVVNEVLVWEEIASLPADVGALTAVGPDTVGDYTFVGTDQGRIFSVETVSRTVTELNVETPPEGPGAIRRIVSAGEGGAFATMDTSKGGHVLGLESVGFEILTGLAAVGPFHGLDISRRATEVTLAVATDDSVWGSSDGGISWNNLSKNLPRRPHCADIRFGEHDGRPALFLSTYGRSVWVAALNPG
jgi:hypothetical protein